MSTRISAAPAEPRKLPKQARSRETVAIIVEAAARILEQHGLDAFNTNAVAERAGVSVGTLYQYFPDRSALLVALTRRERQMLAASIGSALAEAAGGSLEVAVVLLLRAAVAHQLARPALARVLDFVEPELLLDEETRVMEAFIGAQIAGLFASHGVPAAGLAARDVVSATKGIINAAGLAGEIDQNYLLERVRRAVWGYLQASLSR